MRAFRSFITLFLCTACIESYTPPLNSEAINALVVDGYISSNGSASVTLSHTISVRSNADTPGEPGATVTIQSSDGKTFTLTEGDSATYTASNLSVDKNSTYTLHIKTSKGKEYISDEMVIHPTPPIDSIFFEVSNTGEELDIRVNSGSNTTVSNGYYVWDGIETYEYHATNHSDYKFVNGVPIPREPSEQVYVCWRTTQTNAVIASTKNFTSDVISSQRVTSIEKFSPKISTRYSILVRQRVVSEEEYSFLSQIQKTTEQQGSLFSVIPGAVVSNIRSLNDDDEYVLGYFRAQDVQEKRFFIDFKDLPRPFQIPGPAQNCYSEATCRTDQPPPLNGPNGCLELYVLGGDVSILFPIVNGRGDAVAWFYTTSDCGDCRTKGGVTTRPDFWQ